MRKPALVLMATLAAAGCSRSRPITSLERKEAVNDVSEAQFAVTLKDWARAEGLFAKAAQLCPDTGDYWVGLGMARMRLGRRGGAKDAYTSALGAYRDDADRAPQSVQPIVRQIYVLALLGRMDDAKRILEKARRRLPDDRNLREFEETRQLDRMTAEPAFKDVAL